MNIFLVGGAVRDQLLGRPVTERDWVVVGSTVEEMLQLGYKPVGKDFPVFLHPITHEEYALARTERKTGRGYTQFICYAEKDVTLEQDLSRRDLTINAMAQTADGEIIDPFGGQADLRTKTLRHVSSAFVEDPVRILRAARFSARYAFDIAPETMSLMQTLVRAGEIQALVVERVWQEFQRALTEPFPHRFLSVLRQSGALAILFPELDALFGVPNPPKWHPEIDSGIHTLMVLEQAALLSPDPLVRFAALLHDVGKAKTPMQKWPSHPGHEKAGLPLIKALCQRYRVPRDYEALALLTAEYHAHCHKIRELTPATILKTLEKLDAFRRPERFRQFLLCCEADSRGRTGLEKLPYPQSAYFDALYQAAAAVSTHSFIKQGLQGQALGLALRRQRLAILEHFSSNSESLFFGEKMS